MVLTTRDIEIWLQLEPNFLGVFPLNKLPSIGVPAIPNEIKLVINTDTDNLPGTHWIAVWRKEGTGECEVFDSFGFIPPANVQLWCNKNSSRWICNNKCVQDPTSTLCGIYCCMYLTFRHKFNSLDECVKYLSEIV
jgi:hypothetical protein